MVIAETLANVATVQNALRIVAMLQITANLWPPQPDVPNCSCYDVIVVGAGSAGAVVAARLAEHGLAVLLVEAGGNPPIESVLPGLVLYIPRTNEDWNYTANCDGSYFKDCSIPLTSGKMLGGSSSANQMVYVRGHPDDYNYLSQIVQDSSWDWKHLLPYFQKSEGLEDSEVLLSPNGIYHGTNGPLLVTREPHEETQKYLEAFQEIGHNIVLDYNGYDTQGYAEVLYTIAQGVRQSTAHTFLHKDRVPPNLHVLRNTLVTKVLFDSSNRAVGIEAKSSNGESLKLYASKRVVISAGVLNTPKLLMLSGIGPAPHLKSLNIPVLSDLPVGYNLQDHVNTILPFATERQSDEPSPQVDPTKFPTPFFLGFVSLNKTKSQPDYETQNLIMNADSLVQFCSFYFNIEDDLCQQMYDLAKGREVLFSVMTVLHPKSRGRVSLRSSNPTDPPKVDLGYYTNKSDLDTMVSIIEDFLNIANSSYFKDIDAQLVAPKPSSCMNLTQGSKEYWRCYSKCLSISQYHYLGTAPLGTVLDSKLRVRGVERLFVADASAMTFLPSGNINAPVIMIGEKAADIIIQDLVEDPELTCKVNVEIDKRCDKK